jgi:3'(2'), 5'-bisphosphate nucleotidase
MGSAAALERELQVARRLAREAGGILLEVYATAFAVREKPAGGGPVTDADARANTLIVDALRAEFPDDAIIAEESVGATAAHGPRCWYVDPLDGTREFVDRNGMFAVQIGLALHADAVLGVVFAPVSGKLYSGIAGWGGTVEDAEGSRPLHVAPAPARADELRLVVSRSHRSPRTERVRQALGIARVIESGSVGLKCGLLAEGLADLYLHPSKRTYRWDSCAPEAILRAAGGSLTDLAGHSYRYDGRELENTRGLLGCSPGACDLVLPTIREMAQGVGLVPLPP